MARLTVSVEDETVGRLRVLAGGERKVGGLIDEVTTWLWAQRTALDAHSLSEYSLGTDEELAEADRQYATDMERADRLEAEIEEMRSNAAEYQRGILAFLAEQTGRTVEEIEQKIADGRRSQLEAQEDSGNDNA